MLMQKRALNVEAVRNFRKRASSRLQAAKLSANPADIPMIIHVLPARNGLAWVRDGLRLFGRRPISLLASVAAGLLLVTVPAMVSIAGPVLAAILAPIASLGMIAACRAADS